jgi:hypothetical protein
LYNTHTHTTKSTTTDGHECRLEASSKFGVDGFTEETSRPLQYHGNGTWKGLCGHQKDKTMMMMMMIVVRLYSVYNYVSLD